MPPLRFQSVIKIHGGNPYIHISKARATALKRGWRKPLPVLVRIDGKLKAAWRINLIPMGDGRFYLYLHGHVCKASNTAVGDRLEVEVSFDDACRGGPMHPMPAWFAPLCAKTRKCSPHGVRSSPAARKRFSATSRD